MKLWQKALIWDLESVALNLALNKIYSLTYLICWCIAIDVAEVKAGFGPLAW